MRWLFEKRNILENELRAAIYKYIKENPETYPEEIIRKTKLGRGTVLYHLDILLCTGMVACLKDGRLRKFHVAHNIAKSLG